MKVLIADDDPIFSKMLGTMLTRWGYEPVYARDGYEALETLQSQMPPKIAILDYKLPGLNGVSVCRELRLDSSNNVYVILMISRDGLDDVLEGLDAGADDYVAKPVDPGEIKARMQAGRKIAELHGALLYTREVVMEQATLDPLTGLPNRNLCNAKLEQAILDAVNRTGMLAVAYLDLDNFKVINDTLGHVYGDILLKAVAQRLKNCLRSSDILIRMGGDEFAVVIPDIASAEDAVTVTHKIINILAKSFQLGQDDIYISPSIGISIFPLDGQDAGTLIRNAESAMYTAKEDGKNSCRLFTESLNTDKSRRLQMESNLRRALERNELRVYYQPRMDIQTGLLVGAEALVRWEHPVKGLVPPSDFIPLAEETGVIMQITRYVLRQACRQNRKWQEKGYLPIDIAVNVSARDFRDSDMHAIIRDIIELTGIDPAYLNIEITESVIMRNVDSAVRALFDIKDMGVRVSIDDFGTGYSSLSYLKRFPIDAVKIDRSFIKDITENPDDSAIASAVLGMSHAMNLTVVAEGVETQEQLEHLAALGCDEMQGYLISKPVPAEEFEKYLQNPHLLELSQDEQAA